MPSCVNLVLGTMTFGEQVFGENAAEMVDRFLSYGYRELDTAYVYNNGECERILGAVLKGRERGAFKLSTKVNPRVTGRLDKYAVLTQLNTSLDRLGLDKVDTLYLHFPDPDTPVESALEGCAQLYDEGKFGELGLSNFPAWMVSEVYNICKMHGWMLPGVYEGLYNPLSRFAERELDQALSYYGMRFYAYNPLAGGMLTSKYSGKDRTIKEGRFINRPNYQQRYWKDSYFDAVDKIKEVCATYCMDAAEAAYRWLVHHSMLKAERGDAVIVGASRLTQLEQNMQAAAGGELPDDVVEAVNHAWEISRVDAPEYFKYYEPKK